MDVMLPNCRILVSYGMKNIWVAGIGSEGDLYAIMFHAEHQNHSFTTSYIDAPVSLLAVMIYAAKTIVPSLVLNILTLGNLRKFIKI